MAQEMSGLISRRGDDSSLELSPSVVYIEACENFQKQSYRNRCRFYGAEGVQTLSFPILHEGGTHKIPITEIKINYKTPWVQQHERAIISAYGMSAYFDYYKDELFAILEAGHERLFDLNLALIRFFIDKTGIKVDLRLTQDYEREPQMDDFREVIHPKRPNTILSDMDLEKPFLLEALYSLQPFLFLYPYGILRIYIIDDEGHAVQFTVIDLYLNKNDHPLLQRRAGH